MKNLTIQSTNGSTYEVINIPEHVSRETIEEYLNTGKMCELEALGLRTCEYARLILPATPIPPNPSDYVDAIKKTYVGTRYHVKEFMAMETGKSLETIELWLAGKEKIPAESAQKLKDFIQRGQQRS